MRLMGTNQRQSLRRRRKLMPDPRRVCTPAEVEQEATIVRETVATGDQAVTVTTPVEPVEHPAEDQVIVQN